MEEVESFKRILGAFDALRVLRQHILLAETRKLDADTHFLLREEVASFFGVHLSCVVLVGSAKLGFTLKPDALWREFGDNSDIDVAVVSPHAWEKYQAPLSSYYRSPARAMWGTAGSTPSEARKSFLHFLASGWILFDAQCLPPHGHIPLVDEVIQFLDGLTARRIVDFPVNVALYHGWSVLESYHRQHLEWLQQEALGK